MDQLSPLSLLLCGNLVLSFLRVFTNLFAFACVGVHSAFCPLFQFSRSFVSLMSVLVFLCVCLYACICEVCSRRLSFPFPLSRRGHCHQMSVPGNRSEQWSPRAKGQSPEESVAQQVYVSPTLSFHQHVCECCEYFRCHLSP